MNSRTWRNLKQKHTSRESAYSKLNKNLANEFIENNRFLKKDEIDEKFRVLFYNNKFGILKILWGLRGELVNKLNEISVRVRFVDTRFDLNKN